MKRHRLEISRTRSIRVLAAAAAAGLCFLLTDTLEAAGAATQPDICSRACWNARAPKSIPSEMAALNRSIIHHTQNANDYNVTSQSDSAAMVRGAQNWHMDHNGWIDIGYHFLVDKLGNTFAGRYNAIVTSQIPRGTHDGFNTNSFGFSVLGYFHPPHNQTFTTAAREALWQVIAWRMPDGWSPYGSSTYASKTVGRVAGHRDVYSQPCPGDGVWALIGTNYNGGTARNAINALINPAPTVVTVDNNDSGFAASSNWEVAAWASDKHGPDYRWRDTEAISDAATWTGNLPTAGNWRVDAWWSAWENRATAAPYIVDHSGGSSAVNQDQTINGGKWNSLGTFNFGAGNVTTRLSCWTSTGDIVIGDAVRWVKQ